MASILSLNHTLGNVSYVPTMVNNLDQLEVLHELQVMFGNLAENEFDFIEHFACVGWSKYFKLEQDVA